MIEHLMSSSLSGDHLAETGAEVAVAVVGN